MHSWEENEISCNFSLIGVDYTTKSIGRSGLGKHLRNVVIGLLKVVMEMSLPL